ncbi:MAG: nuclear transport factor 2 family protein [Kineosporiaceae bacterium]
MDHDTVLVWVRAYEDAWRAADVDAVPRLFTEDVHYRRSPYEPAEVGLDAVRAFWAEDVGHAFTVEARPVAVEGRVAVVRLLVRYTAPEQQEYSDLWLLRFAADGRVADFEEWAYWPGRSYTVGSG